MLRVILLCFMVGGAGFYLGRLQSEQTVRILGEQRKKAESQIEAMQTELTKLRAEAQTANIKLLQAHKSFNEALPEGPMQDLTLLLKEQIEGGVDPKRLETVLRSVRPPQNCSEPQTKRFVVMTPAYKGPESKMTTSEKEITLSGSGESAKNSKGKSEAWFDPSKEISISFMMPGGDKQEVSGTLPLYHSVITAGSEYRFSITAGRTSFVDASVQKCEL